MKPIKVASKNSSCHQCRIPFDLLVPQISIINKNYYCNECAKILKES